VWFPAGKSIGPQVNSKFEVSQKKKRKKKRTKKNTTKTKMRTIRMGTRSKPPRHRMGAPARFGIMWVKKCSL